MNNTPYNRLRTSLCRTFLLFEEAANKAPMGPIVAARDNLAEAVRSFGYLPSEAAAVIAEAEADKGD